MINSENHIILDLVDTWPTEFLSIIKPIEKELNGFLKEAHRIEDLCRKDRNIRHNKPKNIYENQWDDTIIALEKILMKHKIIGFHCTRLTEYEISDILNNGLRPLDKTLSNIRIKRLYETAQISKNLLDELQDKEELADEFRVGKVYCFHCTSTLKDESGLNRLFGYWGGEAIYAYLKNSQELKEIGESCIVMASIDISDLDIYPLLSKRMLSFYFNDNYYEHDTDTSIPFSLDVIRIIKRNEHLFEDLTGIKNWDTKF